MQILPGRYCWNHRVAVPSSFRLHAGAQFKRFVALTFLPTWACSFELPFKENLSEGSILFTELIDVLIL
jgi:hypothetical protein